MRIFTPILLAIISLGFIACNNSKIEKPKNLPSAKVMENILYDIHYAEAIAQTHFDKNITHHKTSVITNNRNILSDSLYAGILQKYNISDSTLAVSLLYYSSQLNDYDKIYEAVIERINNDLTKQVYQDSLSHALESEEQKRADSITEAIRKHEADSIAKAIHRQFIDSIAEATDRDYDFVVDSIAEAKAARIKFVADSIFDARVKHLVDSIIDVTGEDPKTVTDSITKLERQAAKAVSDSIAKIELQQRIDSIASITGKDAKIVRDSIIKAEEALKLAPDSIATDSISSQLTKPSK
ncbi:MAG: DUF4296 domain-containing protein [Mangrovibacterium sp.]